MSALRTFWKDVVGIDRPKLTLRPLNGHAADDVEDVDDAWELDEAAEVAEAEAEAAALNGQTKERLAVLFAPFKKAVADNGPDARHLQMLFDTIKASIGKRQFLQAHEGLDTLEDLLDEHANPPAGENRMQFAAAAAAESVEALESGEETDLSEAQTLDGFLPPGVDIGIDILKKALGPLSATCIVMNNTGHTLKLDPTSLGEKPHRGEFETPPPAEIPPGQAEFKAKNKRIALLHWTGVRFTVRYFIDPKTSWTLRFDKFRIRQNKSSAKLSGPNQDEFTSKTATVGGKDAVFYFTLDPVGGPKEDPPKENPKEDPKVPPPQPEVNASCLITVKNDTQVELTLSGQTNERGDFMTQPATPIPAGGSIQFAYVTTPKETEPEKQGCKGSVTYSAGSPVAAVWRCEWENLVGEKNAAQAELVPQTAGFATLAQTGQGDENVPVMFTISGGGGTPDTPDTPDTPSKRDDPIVDPPPEPEPEFNPPVEEDEPTLRLNDESVDGWVEYLQDQLGHHVDPPLFVDGIFGPATLKAVRTFQQMMKAHDPSFLVDGIVGHQTWAALRKASPEAPGTDGRKPKSFVDRGAKARWLWESGNVVYYSEVLDELELQLVSVGDEADLEGEKVSVFVTAPGMMRKGVVVRIGRPESEEFARSTYRVHLAEFTKRYPSDPPGASVADYLIEAYFDQELGGDFLSVSPAV
ncbi:MAG: peptidoglycan-binding protein [Gemmataceae bacterium]|nr:peptidoglycan-binding protein [Gemmataceae bacterium]